MAHSEHNVFDRDPEFVVDVETRTVFQQTPDLPSIMQYDHNSERLTFEVPNTVEGHDMADCDRVEVHFINISSNGKKVEDVYEVDDLALNDDNTAVRFTWLVSQNATTLAGSLSFILRFICSTDGSYEYIWSTAIYSELSVGKGMDNAKSIVTQYSDVLESWRMEIVKAGEQWVSKVEIATAKGIAEISEAKEQVLAGISVDDITDAVIVEVAARLPVAEEASF